MKKLACGLLMAGLFSSGFAVDTQPVHSKPSEPLIPPAWLIQVSGNMIETMVSVCKKSTLVSNYGCALTGQTLNGLQIKDEHGKQVTLWPNTNYTVYWSPVKTFSLVEFHLNLIPIYPLKV